MNNKRKLVPLLPSSIISSAPVSSSLLSANMTPHSHSKISKSKLKSKKQKSLRQPKVTTTIINKNPPNSLDQPKPRHLKSCSRCRKHKTKCNYTDTAPNPCTSCSKKGLTCQLEIVISVKRSNIIKNLATSVQDLKDSVEKLVEKDKFLKMLCIQKGLKIDGLIDLDYDLILTPSNDSSPIKVENAADAVDSAAAATTSVPMIASNCSSLLSSLDTDVDSYSSEELLSDIDSHSTCCSSDNDDMLLDDDETFILNADFKISLDEASQLLHSFNMNYLPLIPIITEFKSPFQLYNYSKLLFWTIMFITTKNQVIYNNFIQKNLHVDNNTNNIITESILLMSCFPCTSDISALDLLKFANTLPQTNTNLSSYLYILGNIHSFKNGSGWATSQQIPEVEQRSENDDFIGNFLKFIILQSKLTDDLVFEYQNDSYCSVLLQNSLNSWRFQLNTLKKTNSNDLILIGVMELSMCLFEIIDNDLDKELNLVKSFKIIDELFNHIDSLQIDYCPVWVLFALEFITLVSFKLMFASYNDDQLDCGVFLKCFNRLSHVHGGSSRVINLILEFQSAFKVNATIDNYLTMNSFKYSLIEGLFKDLETHIKLMILPTPDDCTLLPQLTPTQFQNLSKISAELQSLTPKTTSSKLSASQISTTLAPIAPTAPTPAPTPTPPSSSSLSLSLTANHFPSATTPTPQFTTTPLSQGSNSPLAPISMSISEDDDKSLNLTIYNLVNNENIDFFEKSQEENLDVINSILKGMDSWSAGAGAGAGSTGGSGMIC